MFDYAHLEALLAVEREGSFEGAAKFLGVTSSAISQRIRLLEERIGAVVVNRQSPIKPTEIGIRLCRHVEAVSMLEKDIVDQNKGILASGEKTKPIIKIMVNDDSLSSWFLEVLRSEVECHDAFMFDISIVDQDYSIDEIKLGLVQAAISINKKPVQGFTSRFLGMHVYRATASPEFIERHFPDGVTLEALENAPALRYSPRDDLQQQWIKQCFNKTIIHNTHILPSSSGFVSACRKGIAWGMNPALMVDDYIKTGELQELVPGGILNKPLYWHSSRLVAGSLKEFTQNVIDVANSHLDQSIKPGEH